MSIKSQLKSLEKEYKEAVKNVIVKNTYTVSIVRDPLKSNEKFQLNENQIVKLYNLWVDESPVNYPSFAKEKIIKGLLTIFAEIEEDRAIMWASILHDEWL